MAKKNKELHDERLTRLAKYEGLLARWGEASGNIPDMLMKGKAVWYMDKFRAYVDAEMRSKRGS